MSKPRALPTPDTIITPSNSMITKAQLAMLVSLSRMVFMGFIFSVNNPAMYRDNHCQFFSTPWPLPDKYRKLPVLLHGYSDIKVLLHTLYLQ